MEEKKFNLLDEKWIKTILLDGTAKDYSLIEIFKDAHKIKRLSGELMNQDIAILRMMLAILHSIYGKQEDGSYIPLAKVPELPATPGLMLRRWKALWDSKEFDIKTIETYLESYRERFYLFHPEFPFYQVANLQIGTSYRSAKLNGEIAESSNKIRLFAQRSGEVKGALSFSEAARWLIHINAFDDSSGKPKKRPAPAIGTGWLGKLGMILAFGDNLFETLLLNFILLRDGENELWGKEKPIWSIGEVKDAERTPISVPDNQAELLTLQSRRLFLNVEDDSIVGFISLGGDFYDDQQEVFNEQMTCWRKPAKSSRSKRQFEPKRHLVERTVWRDLNNLLVQSDDIKRPGIINWLARLKSEGLLDHDTITFVTGGMNYDSQGIVQDIVEDGISFSSHLLNALPFWANRIADEVAMADDMVTQLARLAENLAKATGFSESKTRRRPTTNKFRSSIREEMYFDLDLPFRQWLLKIDPETTDIDEACEEWWTIVQKMVRKKGRELVYQAGEQGMIGRKINEGTEDRPIERYYSAPKDYNYFLFKTSSRENLKVGK